MNTKEAYQILQDASGIEAGDTVKVLRRAKNYEMGWGNSWTSDMDALVGENLTVRHLDKRNGIKALGCCYYIPFFVLELVSKKQRPTIKVGDKEYYEDELSEALSKIKAI